jgi:hypothetical protein
MAELLDERACTDLLRPVVGGLCLFASEDDVSDALCTVAADPGDCAGEPAEHGQERGKLSTEDLATLLGSCLWGLRRIATGAELRAALALLTGSDLFAETYFDGPRRGSS